MLAHSLARSVLIGAALLAAAPLAAQRAATPQAPAPRTAAAAPFRVDRTGHGRPMILIPGLLSSGEVWQGTVERFRGRYDMHVLTLAGFGGVAPLAGERFLEAERDAIIRYIREQKLDRPVIVGHSLGAFLAFWVAATAPDLVGSVVAVDGVPYLATLGDTTMTPERMRPQAEQMKAVYASFSPAQLEMQTKMAMRTMAKDSATWELGARWAQASDAATAGRAIAEMLTTDLRTAVAEIRAPVLLIAAGDAFSAADRPGVLASYQAQVARVPRRQVVMAESARHFVMLDDPGFFFSTMEHFLGGR